MNTERLIADSGSTKTDWAFADQRIQTQGINPFHQDDDTIRHILQELCETLHPSPSTVLFYGSGVRPELEPKMVRLLREAFPSAVSVEAHSDLLGAARALCGRHEGIACILGTGSNSCLYDGEHIVRNTPSLGYILGDEGGGAVMGIRFLNALYKGQLPASLKATFESTTGYTVASVIDRVYRQELANRWLASLSIFIHEHLDEPGVEALVVGNFRDFVHRNIVPYGRKDLPVSAVGSIAYYFEPQLREAVNNEGYALGRILRSPLEGLVQMEQLG